MANAHFTNVINFVGQDSNIYTITPQGTDVTPLTSDASQSFQLRENANNVRDLIVYAWPTWSPNGQWLAFSRVNIQLPGMAKVELFGYEYATQKLSLIHTLHGPNPPIIGPGIPHYVQWSPDSQKLAFIALTQIGLTLFQSSPLNQATKPTELPAGAPLYFNWSPDSQTTVIHQKDRHFLLDGNGRLIASKFPKASAKYSTPTWSAHGKRIALIAESDYGDLLCTVNSVGQDSKVIKKVQGGTILWSPVDEHVLVCAEYGVNGSGSAHGLSLLHLDTGTEKPLTEEHVLAFFWSPDGQRIMYVTKKQGGGPPMFAWRIIRFDQPGEITPLTEMLPSQALTASLLFFDQYAISHSPWAPDSRHLVLTGYHSKDHLQGPSEVIVFDSDGEESPRTITEGTLAFWSPT